MEGGEGEGGEGEGVRGDVRGMRRHGIKQTLDAYYLFSATGIICNSVSCTSHRSNGLH